MSQLSPPPARLYTTDGTSEQTEPPCVAMITNPDIDALGNKEGSIVGRMLFDKSTTGFIIAGVNGKPLPEDLQHAFTIALQNTREQRPDEEKRQLPRRTAELAALRRDDLTLLIHRAGYRIKTTN